MFACRNCGRQSPNPQSRCPQCHQWGKFVRTGNDDFIIEEEGPVLLSRINTEDISRLETGFPGIDDILGGGLVTGLVYLISGEPGAGKSTLLMQIAEYIGEKDNPALYITGEETGPSLKLRAKRLGINMETILVSDVPEITPIIESEPEWDFAVFDSLHSIYVDDINGRPGENIQAIEVTRRLKSYTKETGVTIFLVGHINKKGDMSGPKAVEHWVDGVLEITTTEYGPREIGINKHRHGPTPGRTELIMGARGFHKGLEVVSNA